MRKFSTAIRRFLTAEEVPRWFGLSIVLLYLVGLACVGNYGIRQAHRDANGYFVENAAYALRLLAKRVSALPGDGPGDPAWVSACQRELRDFASTVRAHQARLIWDGKVVATSHPVLTAEAVLNDRDGRDAGDASGRHVLRAPLFLAPQTASKDGETTDPSTGGLSRPTAYIEAELPRTILDSRGFVQADTFIIVLAVLGAFFVIYRALRRQFKGISRIVDRLQSHSADLQTQLAALRIADTCDEITKAWNGLVELTQKLSEALAVNTANEELSRVLQRVGGGALADVLNALPDGIVQISDEGRFEFLNAAACRMFQWNAAEVKQHTLQSAPVSGVAATFVQLAQSAQQPDGTFEARCEMVDSEVGEGDASSYRLWLIPMQKARHAGGCVLLIRDVSQQIRAERAREEFIAQVTHELRTPLTNIRAYAETLSSGMFEDPKVITECYNVITKETRRLSRLVEDILNVSQLEIGAIDLRVDNVDLRTLLTEGVRDVRGLADEKGIELHLALPSKLEPIRGDRDKLAVVVNNLLGNAIKYTPANGTVIVGCQVTSDSAVITVKDNGIGIAPAEHHRVFEKFQRGSNPEVQKETGTGIGLYTAREIVRRHGGDIELISELQKGATFLVRLPLPESRANSLTTAKAGAAHG